MPDKLGVHKRWTADQDGDLTSEKLTMAEKVAVL